MSLDQGAGSGKPASPVMNSSLEQAAANGGAERGQRQPPSPEDDVTAQAQRQRRNRCCLVTVLVLALVIIAGLAIGLGIYFGNPGQETDVIGAEEVCYPPCGCFNKDPPFNTRLLPEGWEQRPIHWLLYTRSNPTVPVDLAWPNVTAPPELDEEKKTVFLIHGWYDNKETLKDIRDAILGSLDYNVIVVDWQDGASVEYEQSASNTRVVGACSAHVASRLADLSHVHCVGHSLGGQTCGYMGKALKGDGGQPQLARITGLDPAGPLFSGSPVEVRIDKTDAVFVDNIHTDVRDYGIGQSLGDVDFYPNKGLQQPGCEASDSLCDHVIVSSFYAASISAKADSCNFDAYPCDDLDDAHNGGCNSCTAGGDCQMMGFYADTMPGRGQYYLETVAGYPYCKY